MKGFDIKHSMEMVKKCDIILSINRCYDPKLMKVKIRHIKELRK
jgi:hypothetical protein